MESLRGQFLVAMPGMGDERFHDSVVYVVGHGEEGAMGLVVNQPVEDMRFADILDELGIAGKDDENIRMPSSVRDREVLRGGPVQRGRGFVLHSDDYLSDSSIPVSDDICLTATLDIVRAISRGEGPVRATMMLGYAGWGPGQLESEITQNGWLTCPARDELIFDKALDDKYDRALALMGVSAAMLSMDAGHA